MDGRLKEGERLPSENGISSQFGVSRPIVRAALLRLRLEGLLHARQGSGTYVLRQAPETGPRPPRRSRSPRSCAASRCGCRSKRRLKARAQRRTPEQLASIEAAHEDYRRSMEAGEMLYGNDLALHLTVADASGNPQFGDVLRHVEDPVTGSRSLSLSLVRPRMREKEQQIWSEHGHVVEAIRAGDAEAAQVAMQFHLNQIRRRMIEECGSNR